MQRKGYRNKTDHILTPKVPTVQWRWGHGPCVADSEPRKQGPRTQLLPDEAVPSHTSSSSILSSLQLRSSVPRPWFSLESQRWQRSLCLSSPSSSAQGLWHLLEPSALLAKEDADAGTFPSGGRGTWPRSSLCCQCSFCCCFHLLFRLWLKCHLLQETSLIALSDIAPILFMLFT